MSCSRLVMSQCQVTSHTLLHNHHQPRQRSRNTDDNKHNPSFCNVTMLDSVSWYCPPWVHDPFLRVVMHQQHHSSLNSASHLARIILEIMKAKCIVVICGPLLCSISFILAYSLPQMDYLSGLAFQTSNCLMVYQTRQPARNYVVWERIVRRIILLHVQNVLLVKAMGKGIPGGYAGRGTPGMDKDTDFCTHCHTRTPTCQTHTRRCGFDTCAHSFYIVYLYFIILFCYFILFLYLFICLSIHLSHNNNLNNDHHVTQRTATTQPTLQRTRQG